MDVIVWGKKFFIKKKGTMNTISRCDCCGIKSYWRLLRVWKWFTLYFIPIIPVSIMTILVCPACGNGIKISSANHAEIMAQINKDKK